LTGLPNRVLLFDRIKQAIAFEKRHNTLLALMVLDLDNFKYVNDSLGHLAGDNILRKVAARLQNCVRQYDTVGRLGGDEFVLLINDASSIQDIVAFAEKVLSVFSEPFDVSGQHIYMTTSIGIAVYPLHGTTIETLLRKADLAMYVAKKSGRNTYRFFSESADAPHTDMKDMRDVRRRTQIGKLTQGDYSTDAVSSSSKEHVIH
jgi:diguanylate cyclase (GGDEF)-like protein